MEILKSSHGGKPTSTVISWAQMKSYGIFWKMELVTWILMKKGGVVDRKKYTPAQKKMYKKHHKIRDSLVTVIPRAEYMKISDNSTAKAIFASLCANYEGSKKVREAKALMLVHQYELFKMKDDESIKDMYSRF